MPLAPLNVQVSHEGTRPQKMQEIMTKSAARIKRVLCIDLQISLALTDREVSIREKLSESQQVLDEDGMNSEENPER